MTGKTLVPRADGEHAVVCASCALPEPTPPPVDVSRVNALDRLMSNRMRLFFGVAVVMVSLMIALDLAGWLEGVALHWILLIEIGMMSALMAPAALYWAFYPGWLIGRGQYEHALGVLDLLEKDIGPRRWFRRVQTDVAMLRAEILGAQGRVPEAKAALANLPEPQLDASRESRRRLHLAILYVRIVDPESALECLHRIDRSSLAPVFHISAASHEVIALLWLRRFQEVDPLLDFIRSRGRGREHDYALRSLEGLRLLEESDDAEGAAAHLLPAVEALPPASPVYVTALVTLRYFQLEAGTDPVTLLELMQPILPHVGHLDARARAVFHYVLARCQLESGLVEAASKELEVLEDLPVNPLLRPRVEVCRSRIQQALPGAARQISPV